MPIGRGVQRSARSLAGQGRAGSNRSVSAQGLLLGRLVVRPVVYHHHAVMGFSFAPGVALAPSDGSLAMACTRVLQGQVATADEQAKAARRMCGSAARHPRLSLQLKLS